MIKFITFWFIPVLIVLVDILLRFSRIVEFSSLELTFYLASIVFSFLLYKGLHAVLFKMRHSFKIYPVMLFLVSFFYCATLILSSAYFLSMGIMPNYFTIEFFRSEPINTLIIIYDSLSVFAMLFILLFVLLLAKILHISVSLPVRPYVWPLPFNLLHLISVIILALIFNNNVRFVDQCFVSDVNLISFTGRNFYNQFFNKTLGSTGLMARNRILLKTNYSTPPYNVLIVVGESLRTKNMHLYGYERETTPFLTKRYNEYRDQTFVFNRHYANSTATLLAYPSLLNGISPVQPSALYHSAPLMFEYAKKCGYHTFLISSHDYNFYNFRSFFASQDIGYFWEKKTSGMPAVNDMGINDSIPVVRAIQHIDSCFKVKQQFMGIIHLNTNHYPYNVPQSYEFYKGTTLDKYDNTVRYQDYLLERIFHHLEKAGQLDNTVIMFVSDHGEAFNEHGFVGHRGFYYLELLHIPLVIHIPIGIREEFNIAKLIANQNNITQNLDVMPTFLDFLKISHSAEIVKIKKDFMGKTLFGDINNERDVYIVNNNTIARYQEGVSLISDSLHYLYQLNRHPQRNEVYNIVLDPDEKNNLWPSLTDSERNSFVAKFDAYPILREMIK